MAHRQRFIWPEIWKDPVFGRLAHDEQVLFIGLFSIADDEGRTYGDAAYLRGELFTYKDYTVRRVKAIRDRVTEKCDQVRLYNVAGTDYIALLRWANYQKPKYPRASKLPPPFPEDSPNLPPSLPEDSPKLGEGLPPHARPRITRGVGLGWEDLKNRTATATGSKEKPASAPQPGHGDGTGVFDIDNLLKEM